MSDVYYKLFVNRSERVTVVCMQDFDEDDYCQSRFLKDKRGYNYKFESEAEAVAKVFEIVKPEYIDPSLDNPNADWVHLLK